jgi:hypothetical protein
MTNACRKVSGIRITRTNPAAVLLCPPRISRDLIPDSGCGGKPAIIGLSCGRAYNTVPNDTTTSHVNEHFETYPRKNEENKYISGNTVIDKYLIHSTCASPDPRIMNFDEYETKGRSNSYWKLHLTFQNYISYNL